MLVSPFKLIKSWVWSPGKALPKMAERKPVDKANDQKGAKYAKSKRSIDFHNDDESTTRDKVVHAQEMEVKPGDKRLASSPEDQSAHKRTAPSAGELSPVSDSSLQSLIPGEPAIEKSPDSITLNSALKYSPDLSPSENKLADIFECDMSVSDLEDTRIEQDLDDTHIEKDTETIVQNQVNQQPPPQAEPIVTEQDPIIPQSDPIITQEDQSIPQSEPITTQEEQIIPPVTTQVSSVLTSTVNTTIAITSTPTTSSTTVTYSGPGTVMSTLENVPPTYPGTNTVIPTTQYPIFDIPKPKLPEEPAAASTPALPNPFARKEGAGNFTDTPDPRPGINQRLQAIADGPEKTVPSVRFKPNQAEPIDENSRRTPFQTPNKNIQFGQNPFTFGSTNASPSMFGFSPIHINPPHAHQPTDFNKSLVNALKDKEVVTALATVIDRRCSDLMTNIQKQLIILNNKIDIKNGKPPATHATLPDPNQPLQPVNYQRNNDKITHEILFQDRIDQVTRRNNVKISGLIETTRDRTFKVVMETFRSMDMDIRDEDILRCHRLGKKSTRTRPILVVFTSMPLRNMLMRNRYRLYEPGSLLSHIHINEDLTPARSTLTYRCRQSGKFRSVWTYDGEVYVRPWNRDKKAKGDRLFCEQDIEKYQLLDGYQQANAYPQPANHDDGNMQDIVEDGQQLHLDPVDIQETQM